jgi:hypothetical protein
VVGIENFVKNHMVLAHAFDDIEQKGPAKNFSATIGEHGHVYLKADFQHQTNGRDFESQVRAFITW